MEQATPCTNVQIRMKKESGFRKSMHMMENFSYVGMKALIDFVLECHMHAALALVHHDTCELTRDDVMGQHDCY